MRKLDPKILISAHDLGGANQLLYSPMGSTVYYSLTGPARQVAENLRLVNQVQPVGIDLSRFNKVIVSSNVDFQYSDQLLLDAKKLGITTVGYLDHWVNFKNRWSTSPDKVVVTDIMAFWNAFLVFGFKVRLHRNYYVKFLKAKFSVIQEEVESSQALFIVQPKVFTYEHEKSGLKCVCGSVDRFLNFYSVNRITIRDHFNTSSESCIQALTTTYPHLNIFSSNWDEPLENDIFRSKYVIGYDSYALYIARKLGKHVLATGKRRAWVSPRYTQI